MSRRDLSICFNFQHASVHARLDVGKQVFVRREAERGWPRLPLNIVETARFDSSERSDGSLLSLDRTIATNASPIAAGGKEDEECECDDVKLVFHDWNHHWDAATGEFGFKKLRLFLAGCRHSLGKCHAMRDRARHEAEAFDCTARFAGERDNERLLYDRCEVCLLYT